MEHQKHHRRKGMIIIERHFVEIVEKLSDIPKRDVIIAHIIDKFCRCRPYRTQGLYENEFIWIHQSFAEKAVTADEARNQKGD